MRVAPPNGGVNPASPARRDVAARRAGFAIAKQSGFNWQLAMAVSLTFLSAVLYLLHWKMFGNVGQTMNYLLANIAFLPFEVLLVTLILNRLLSYREKLSKLEKLNMVIGSFFSEAGLWLLAFLSDADPELESIKQKLIVSNGWSEKDFIRLSKDLEKYSFNLDREKLDLFRLKGFVVSQRNFLLRLIENPNLLEHETFTELLLAYFHLIEELSLRIVISPLIESDLKHIAGDAGRVYALLVTEWVAYMKHLLNNYPYLFSLAMRTNPFDERASVEVRN